MRTRTFVLGAAAAVALSVAALLIGEAVWVGVFASDTQVAEYRFGSEPMVGYGGQAYESASRYVLSGLWQGVVLLVVAITLSLGAFRSKRRPNKPLQPTRAAGPNEQREAPVSGPRG